MISAITASGNITFKYNDNGLRVSKTKNGIETVYYYDGTRLVAEKNQNETIIYIYDDYGSVIGMQYRLTTYAEDVWDVYWFERNLQGDIVGVYNKSGTKLISYTYDAWGNFTTTYYNNGASTTAVKNPFRYRGYYYDSDLQLYYLQTRYYDSVTGRFISADSIIPIVSDNLDGFNLYCYCLNNPVNLYDPTGKWWEWIVDAANWVNDNILVPVSAFICDVVEDIKNYDRYNTDEQKALDSNYFSSYKGVFVLRTGLPRSASFGMIFLQKNTLGYENPEDIVRHEYGHTIQLKLLGPLKYAVCIGIPSAFEWGDNNYNDYQEYFQNYHKKQWEITADYFGGVRSRLHSQDELQKGFDYLRASRWFGIFSWFLIDWGG